MTIKLLLLLSFQMIVHTRAAERAVWKNQIGMKFVEIPAGSFQDYSQGKLHIRDPFSIGLTEVTQLHWKAVMGYNPSQHKGTLLPVEMISWSQAVEFCQRLTSKDGRIYRLPKEAEWEWACRASQSTLLANDVSQRAWTMANTTKTMPVAQRTPNPWGLHDMQGNVAELCSDIHYDHLAKTRTQRLVKGGAFCYGRRDAFPGARMGVESARGREVRTNFIGFRVLCEQLQ